MRARFFSSMGAAAFCVWLAVFSFAPSMTVWMHSDGSLCQTCPASFALQSAPKASADCCEDQNLLSAEKTPTCRDCCAPQTQNAPDLWLFAPFVLPSARLEARPVAHELQQLSWHGENVWRRQEARGPPPSRGPPSWI